MAKRCYTSADKFWSVMERELIKNCYCESIPSYIEQIFAYQDLDSFTTFENFAKGTPFPYEDLKNAVRSDSYMYYAYQTEGTNQLPNEKMILYYGKKCIRNTNAFDFSTGDKLIIDRMVNFMKEILNLEKKERKKLLRVTKRTLMDLRASEQPDFELIHLRALLNNRKTQCEQYNRFKNQVFVELDHQSRAATFTCLICQKKFSMHKFFKRGEKSYWNLSNFFRHVDHCKFNVRIPNALPAANGNTITHTFF